MENKFSAGEKKLSLREIFFVVPPPGNFFPEGEGLKPIPLPTAVAMDIHCSTCISIITDIFRGTHIGYLAEAFSVHGYP